jgi:hypothetical protein
MPEVNIPSAIEKNYSKNKKRPCPIFILFFLKTDQCLCQYRPQTVKGLISGLFTRPRLNPPELHDTCTLGPFKDKNLFE